VRLLVTGGTGALGRALLPRAQADGHQVSAPGRVELDLFDPAAVAVAVAARNDLAWMTGEALRCRGLARAEAALREAGGRRGSRGRPRSGWDSLTPTEHSVAGLVAEGLPNPQIGERLYISSRTVQTHLAHVFAKLDISARAQLAAEVTRRSSV